MLEQSKKKRGPWLYVSIVGCLTIILAIFLLVFSQNNLSKFGQKIAGAKENQPKIETTKLQVPFENVQIFGENYETLSTTYIIEYPQLEDDYFNESILHFIHNETANFLALAEQNVVKKNKPNTFNSTVETHFFNERFYSFTFKANTKLGDGMPTEHVSTFIYDTETAEFVTFQQLLNNNIRYLETFTLFVQQQLLQNSDLKDTLVDKKTLTTIVAPTWEQYTTYAIENKELVIYYQPGEVATVEQGIVEVRTNMTYLQSILADPFDSKSEADVETLPLVADNRKRVALTFDDGPHPKVTQQILDILDEFDAKATFFMLGKNIEKYPDITKDVHARGHEIGNHTWTHPLMTKLSLEEAIDEYTKTEALIVQTIGENATVFRPPFGATNDAIKTEIALPSVNWSIDTLDWKHRNPQQTLKILKANMHNNAIVLLHDIHQPTADGLRAVMQYLDDAGYEFLTLSEVMPYVEYNM